jgi:hypothetical protein
MCITETIANQPVKRRRTKRAKDHSSIINSSVLPNQGLVINYNNNQVEVIYAIRNLSLLCYFE